MSCISRVAVRSVWGAAALAFGAGLAGTSASASSIDLASLPFAQIDTNLNPLDGLFGSGGTATTSFTIGGGPGVDVTMSTSGTREVLDLGLVSIGTVDSRLKGGSNGGGLIQTITGADGVCAGGRGAVLTELDCGAPVTFDFSANPISSFEIAFDQNLDILSGMNIEVVHGGGTASGSVFTLAEVGLLDVVGLSLFDLSGFYLAYAGITKVTYTPSPLLGLVDAGGPVARYLTVNESQAVAPVPLPPAGFALLAALGGLGFLRRRTTAD